MTELTPRLGLPCLSAGQAQKEFYHNEALLRLDVMVANVVEEEPRNTPPATPAAGTSYIVGPAPTGVWLGKANMIAAFDSYGWRFLNVAEGASFWVRSRGVEARWTGGNWTVGALTAERLVIGGDQVVGPRSSAIADPAGGATADAEARAAVGAILSALREHGLIAS